MEGSESFVARYWSRLTFLTALAGAGAACVAPPPETPEAAAPGAGNAPPAENAPPASGGVVWNGDDTGGSAKGWADCDKKPECKASLAATPGAGNNGGMGLKFHGEGPGWIGMGWNWFGWYPETAGTDVSGYKSLTFRIRIDGKSKELAPDLSGSSIALGCSKGKKNSADAALSRYARDALDGKWHDVKIPIAHLMKGKGSEFDPKTAWEFRLSIWSGTPRHFDIYIDDIAFEK
jgi:hypothetical protein